MTTVVAYIKEFGAALKQGHTYNPFTNGYLCFGILWGFPIPLVMLMHHGQLLYELQDSGSLAAILINHPFYWFFIAHPLIFGIVFGALGTVHQQKAFEIEKLIDRLRVESTHDTLTGLYNRAFFESAFHKELARIKRSPEESGEKLALLMLDLDKFKRVNDVYGHLVGDVVLKQLAKVLLTNCRSYDTVARFGGEEFSLVLPHTPQDKALMIAERIREEFAALKYKSPKGEFSCTVSIGLSCSRPGDSMCMLIQRADEALYRAKAAGRNCIKDGENA